MVTIVYTGAPEAADYEYAKTIEHFSHAVVHGAKTKSWRKVAIDADPYRTGYQCDRYRSFLGGCPTLDDPRVVPIGMGKSAPSLQR